MLQVYRGKEHSKLQTGLLAGDQLQEASLRKELGASPTHVICPSIHPSTWRMQLPHLCLPLNAPRGQCSSQTARTASRLCLWPSFRCLSQNPKLKAPPKYHVVSIYWRRVLLMLRNHTRRDLANFNTSVLIFATWHSTLKQSLKYLRISWKYVGYELQNRPETRRNRELR